MRTDRTDLWRGAFGDAYTERNTPSRHQISARLGLWSEILKLTAGEPPRSFLEVGCNIGSNLRAIKLLTQADIYALEPNDKAREILLADGVVQGEKLRGGTAERIEFSDEIADLVFTSGVLIHIPPDHLLPAAKEIHRCSKRFIACIEYFSDRPETIPYRGETEALFKRDFGGFWLDNFSDLRVLGYGFAWKRVTGLDNLTWWLFEKRDKLA